MQQDDREMYIVDTDPGIDDARALLYLLSQNKVNVLALTTVGGNSYTVQSSYNAGITLHAIGRTDIPVFQGSITNLEGKWC